MYHTLCTLNNSASAKLRPAQKAVKTAVQNTTKSSRKAAEKQNNSRTEAAPQIYQHKPADLFGLGEEALAHFCARTCHKNRAVRIQVHQARPAREAGVESAVPGQA